MLDVVRAAELLVNKPSSPTDMLVPKSPGGPKTDLKTTTIVMSKHTLAPQTSTVSTQHFMQYCLSLFICKFVISALNLTTCVQQLNITCVFAILPVTVGVYDLMNAVCEGFM